MVISDRIGTMGETIKKEGFHMAYMKEDGYESSDASVSSISSSTSDAVDDPTSSSYSSSSTSYSFSLYQQPSLMANQLPIKRGLSKFYQGKSESFTSLSDVISVVDLAKKENPYKRKMKGTKSYAGGLEDLDGTVDSFCFARAKKSSRNSFVPWLIIEDAAV